MYEKKGSWPCSGIKYLVDILMCRPSKILSQFAVCRFLFGYSIILYVPSTVFKMGVHFNFDKFYRSLCRLFLALVMNLDRVQ